jgi:hypothetical protein
VFKDALNYARHKDLKDWEDTNIAYTVGKKRKEFLNKNKGKSEIQKTIKTSCVRN